MVFCRLWLLLVGLFSLAEYGARSGCVHCPHRKVLGSCGCFFRNWELLLCLWVEAFSIKEAGFSEDKFGGARPLKQ